MSPEQQELAELTKDQMDSALEWMREHYREHCITRPGLKGVVDRWKKEDGVKGKWRKGKGKGKGNGKGKGKVVKGNGKGTKGKGIVAKGKRFTKQNKKRIRLQL